MHVFLDPVPFLYYVIAIFEQPGFTLTISLCEMMTQLKINQRILKNWP